MRKILKTILVALGILGISSIAYATQVTVPSAPGVNYALVSTSTGNYIYTLLPSCTSASNALTFNLTTNSYGCNTITGGGGSGGGTWATTTSAVPAWLINYPLNTTDIVCIGGTATSTCKFIFDPNSNIGYFNGLVGIGTKSPTYPLDVVGLGHFTGLVDAANFVATSTVASKFPNASTTQLTLLGQLYDGTNSAGTGGQILMSRGAGNAPTWVASTTFNSPLSFSNGAVSLSTAGTWSGNAGTATALAANGTNCSSGSYPLGVDASGNSENCTVATTGTVTSVATNNGLTGGTITNTGTLGLIISGLTTNMIVGWNGSQLQATGTDSLTVPKLFATTTATSTFVGPLATASASTTATSTMAGINLPYGGCVAVAGVCLTNNAGTVTSVATNAGLTGGTITGAGTLGLDTTGLSTNGLLTWNGSKLFATGTTGTLTVPALISTSTTATSTFAAGLQATYINLTGGISATNTAASGFNLTAGCFAIANVCIGGGSGSGTVTSVATNNGLTGGTITGAGTLGLDLTKLVSGALTFWNGSQLQATGTQQLTVGNLLATTSTATSTFMGGIVGPNNFTVQQTSGWVGIASATPMSGFVVGGGATTTLSGDLKVGATVASTSFTIDYLGHMMTGGAQPTCGTGCSTVVGDDNSMRVVTGTTISNATVNFASTWKNSAGVSITPVCVASEESAGTVTADASSTPTTVVLEFASALTSTRISVQCQASDNFSF